MMRQAQILQRKKDDHHLELMLYVPAELEDFNGHFAGHPLLPGVTQIDWVMKYAQQELAIKGQFAGMEVLKFQAPILPKQQVTLVLDWQADKNKLYFCYQSQTQQNEQLVHSSGRIVLTH